NTRCYRDWSSDVCSSDLALEARDARNHDRKERQQEHQQELGHEAEPEPDDEQWRDRDLRNDLQEYDHRVDRLLHEARIGHRQRQRNAYDHGKRVTGKNFPGCDPCAGGDQLVAPPEFGPHFRRRRQQIFLDVGEAYRKLPQQKQQHEDRQRAAAIAEPRKERRAAASGHGYRHGGGGSGRSQVPYSAGSLISSTSRSSARAITLCATPAGCDNPSPARSVTSPSTPAKRKVSQPRST